LAQENLKSNCNARQNMKSNRSARQNIKSNSKARQTYFDRKNGDLKFLFLVIVYKFFVIFLMTRDLGGLLSVSVDFIDRDGYLS